MIDYEKLGAFYLGKSFDMAAGEVQDDLILYDSKDLTTHGVIVGMTGSGKTGLGVSLLEEAAIDQIPSIVIDPKGDMANLLLAFPKLRPEDFREWVDKDEATRKGMSEDEFAADRAALWKKGLAEWGQKPERIKKFADAADVAVYTPGSDAGLQLTVLKSLAAPPEAVLASSDAMRERINGAASGICTLLDLDADPIRSREHILLSNVLDRAWREPARVSTWPRTDLRAIQSPPFQIKSALWTSITIFPAGRPDGTGDDAQQRPRLARLQLPGPRGRLSRRPAAALHAKKASRGSSILSIAHLSDRRADVLRHHPAQRSAGLDAKRSPARRACGRCCTWTKCSATSRRRPIPPSKTPMLTLLKQARAFGLGLVLATQNPVDLDYKALSNTGTWFLGRLQTERDKQRVLDGLEGASANAGVEFDRRRIEQILSGVSSRVFLMNNVHEDEPVVFHTRWALSYLAGPMTREQIGRLMANRKAAASPALAPSTAAAASPAAAAPVVASTPDEPSPLEGLEPHPPVLSSRIEQRFLAVARGVPREAPIRYEPALAGIGRVHFVDDKANVNVTHEVFRVCPADDRLPTDPWDDAESLDAHPPDVDDEPLAESGFIELPGELSKSTRYTKWKSAFKNKLYRDERVELLYCKALDRYSQPGQIEGDFRVDLRQDAREARDLELEKIKAKYADKFEKQDASIQRAEHRLATEQEQAESAKQSAWVSTGTSILGALFGRKLRSTTNVTRAGSAMKAHTRASQQAADIAIAEEKLEQEIKEREQLEEKLEQATAEIKQQYDADALVLTPYEINPRRSDISVDTVALLWRPYRADTDEPAWETGVE